MNTQTDQQQDFIRMVANHLAEKYIDALFTISHIKTYAAHIGGLAEILDWANEFSEQYYSSVMEWQTFHHSKFNINNTETVNDLIIAFGEEKLRIFYSKNSNNSNYFLEKYSAVTTIDYYEEF